MGQGQASSGDFEALRHSSCFKMLLFPLWDMANKRQNQGLPTLLYIAAALAVWHTARDGVYFLLKQGVTLL